MHARRAFWLLGAVSLGTLAACSSPPDEEQRLGTTQEPLTAVCQANVKGVGLVDTEDKYLPGVVHCENGGAPFEALKAQAIVARSYLYYKMETSGAIADGTGDQVYTCGSAATALQIKAVKDTAGQVLRYKGITVCAFFVAGGAGTPPGCIGSASASTEKFVTYNEGKSGTGITQTTLGFVSPTNYRNRGCLSQLGSRCLDTAGKNADEILRFYYGSDIVIETATGPCVPTTPPPDAGVDTGAPDTGSKDAPVTDSGVTDRGDAVDDALDGALDDTGAPDADPKSDGAPSADLTTDGGSGCACSLPRADEGQRRGVLALAVIAALVSLVTRRRRTSDRSRRSVRSDR